MRLTEINENKLSEELRHCLEGNGCEDCTCCELKSVLTCQGLLLQKAYKVVKEYEEMEEQCNKENSWGLRMLLHKWKEFIEDIQELYEYRKLEEQKKLLKLPCTVGDTVYHLCTFGNGESEIIEMKVGCVEPCGSIRQHNGVCEIWNVYAETDCTKAYFRFFDFNKTVFLNKEAAEAALKKMSE